MVSIIILTALNMKEIGKMISNMERAMKHGPMEANSTDTMSIPRNKAKASTFGQMATST